MLTFANKDETLGRVEAGRNVISYGQFLTRWRWYKSSLEIRNLTQTHAKGKKIRGSPKWLILYWRWCSWDQSVGPTDMGLTRLQSLLLWEHWTQPFSVSFVLSYNEMLRRYNKIFSVCLCSDCSMVYLWPRLRAAVQCSSSCLSPVMLIETVFLKKKKSLV